MLEWVSSNAANIIIVLILAAVVGYAVRTIYLNRKNGKCSCGGNCGSCGMYGSCSDGGKQEKSGKNRK
ncbi:MAG: FeoB-associated Cys-rich membrane protein [Lachnospiraceae bacterium]|nr:FeoB-associated Cys-rich membrane protein [Lachnospiraceae bacterium]